MPSCISATNLPRTLSHFHTHQNQKFRLKQKQNFKNYLFSMRVQFEMGSVKGAMLPGVPQYWIHFVFLSFSRVLEHVQRNFWPLINSPGNLLHNSHKNFENWFRNSWHNWHQSWHLSFRNWHFTITTQWGKNIILVLQVAFLISII